MKCIVVWDDQQGLCVPMTFDKECEGALCAWSAGEKVALFCSRSAARRAIRISTRFAQMRMEQGKVYNDDFIGDAKRCLRVVGVNEAE